MGLQEACGFSAGRDVMRRYTRDMLIAGALYTAVVFAAVALLNRIELSRSLMVLAAIAPLAPALLMLRAYLMLYRALDEFQRRLQSEAIVIAAGVVGFAAFAYGFLEEWAGFPHVGLIWILPALIQTWWIASVLIRRRYRADDEEPTSQPAR